MKPRIKAKWLKALRSGKYKQGEGALKNHGGCSPDSYCCLGVLCDLHSKETGTPWDGTNYLTEISEPSYKVVKWAGLPDSNPEFLYQDRNVSLASLNDGTSSLNISAMSFKEIADIIENRL